MTISFRHLILHLSVMPVLLILWSLWCVHSHHSSITLQSQFLK